MSDRNIKSANTPVTYKTTLDVSAFEKVKLEQTFDDGSHKKVSFPIFTGDGSKTGNTEALIHCLDQYIRHTSKDLQWEDQERFDNLEDVLTGEAFAYWTEEVVPRYENTPVPRFDPAIALFIQRFSGGDRGRDRLIRYLQGVSVRKDVEVSVQEHFGRLTHMMNISDRLSGIEFPPLTQVQRKRVLIESLPHQWRVNFNNTGLDYVAMSTIEIENYFTLQQEMPTSNSYTSNSDSSNSTEDSNASDSTYYSSESEACHKHPNAKRKHTWRECFLNKYGPNYKRTKHNHNRSSHSNDAHNNQEHQQQRMGNASAEHFANAGETHVFENRVGTTATGSNRIWNPALNDVHADDPL